MDPRIHALHIQAGLKAGKDRTCTNKVSLSSEEAATKVAVKMNAKPTCRHEVEAYPCAFCGKWHTGRRMTLEELESTGKAD